MTDNPLPPADPKKSILCYAVYKAWKDNPKDVAVQEYFNTVEEAKAYIKEQKEILCQLIDLMPEKKIYLEWDCKYVSKKKAKEYVMSYGE